MNRHPLWHSEPFSSRVNAVSRTLISDTYKGGCGKKPRSLSIASVLLALSGLSGEKATGMCVSCKAHVYWERRCTLWALEPKHTQAPNWI